MGRAGEPAESPRLDAAGIDHVGLAAAVVALGALTFTGAARHSLWLDEAYTAAAVRHLGTTLSATRGTMPLYYAVMWVWGQVSLSPLWLRVPSIAASLGSLVGVQVIARRILPRIGVAVAPVLLVMVPMFQVKAVEARPYAIWTCLVVFCWCLVLRIGEVTDAHAKRRYVVYLTLAAIVGPFIHGLFICQLFAMAVFVLVDRRRRVAPRTLVAPIASSAMMTLVLMDGNPAGAGLDGAMIPLLVDSFIGMSTVAIIIVAALQLTGVVELGRAVRRGATTAWLPIVWAVVPLVILIALAGLRGLFYPRYMAPSAPAMALIGASGIGALVGTAQRVRFGRPRTLTARSFGVAVIVIVVVALGALAVGPSRPPGETLESWGAATRYVAAGARPGDGLMFNYWDSPSWRFRMQFRVPFAVAWSELDEPPRLTVIGRPESPGAVRRVYDDPSDRLALERLGGFERVWVVSYRESWQEGVVTSRSFERAFKKVGSRTFPSQIHVDLYVRRARVRRGV